MARCVGSKKGEVPGSEVHEGVQHGGPGGGESRCAENMEDRRAEEGCVKW